MGSFASAVFMAAFIIGKAVTEGRNQGIKIGDLVMDKLMAAKKEMAKAN